MILDLVKTDNPVLRRKATKVVSFNKGLDSIIKNLRETLVFTGGLGIAAPQAGIPYQIFLTSLPNHPTIYINPIIVKTSDQETEMEEGCLSIPGYRGTVTRPETVTVSYQDKKGARKTIIASGLLAKVLQHETDHLGGILYIDRMTKKDKLYKIIPLRVVFFGTPDFGVPTLRNLIGLKHSFEYEVVGVVTSTQHSPVAKIAKSLGVEILALGNDSLRDPKIMKKISDWQADIFVLASFGKILPKELLALPKHGAINLHPSLLPKYRGASPIQAALYHNETRTGITAFLMNEKMDEGGILDQREIEIAKDDNYQTLHDKISTQSADWLVSVLHKWIDGKLKPTPQDNSQATYTRFSKPNTLIAREDGYIDLSNPPSKEIVTRMVRAFHPWPGVWTRLENGKLVKLLPKHQVQLEGKQPRPLKEFKHGYPEFNLDW